MTTVPASSNPLHQPEILQASLARWGLPAESDVRLLNISENVTYRIHPPGAAAIVLRVHRPSYHERQEIRSEIVWIDALRHDGVVETPAPLRGLDGEAVQQLPAQDGVDRFAVAFTFANGAEPSVGADLPGWFEKLGRITARLHRHARGWTPPSDFRRKTWDWDAMFGVRPLWGDWRAGLGLDTGSTALLGRGIDLVGQRLRKFGRAPSRFGLIHADLRLANLLVEGEHLRVIDFDDCGFSWHLYDFAAAVSFFEHEPIVEALRESWVAGYRSVAPLPEEDAAELPTFIAMRRFLLVAWIASHPEVPIARELGADYTWGALEMADRLLTTFT